jgi:hypothetical protein
VCLQVLPAMGCVLPEDATLIAPNQLYGSLLSLVCTEEPLRQAWWSAESASASAAAKSIVVTADDAVWAALDSSEEPGQDAWQLDVVFTGVSSRMHALLARLFTRCMWLGAAPTRILMVQVVLGAAIDVCSPPSELSTLSAVPYNVANLAVACVQHFCSVAKLSRLVARTSPLPGRHSSTFSTLRPGLSCTASSATLDLV